MLFNSWLSTILNSSLHVIATQAKIRLGDNKALDRLNLTFLYFARK
jgi:hypothetical protein